MKRLIIGLSAWTAVGLFTLSLGGRADEPAKQEKKADPAKELAALQKEWSDAQQAFFKAYQLAKTNEERQKILKEKQPKADDFADRFLKLAETYPDRPEASQARVWILTNARNSKVGEKLVGELKKKLEATTDLAQVNQLLAGLPAYNFSDLAPLVAEKVKKKLDDPQAVPVLMWVCSATAYTGNMPELAKVYDSTVDLLVERFVDRPELGPLTGWLPYDTNPDWAEKHLRRLMEKNSDAGVKSNAKFGLASLLAKKDAESQPEAEKLFQAFIEDAGKAPDKQHLVQQAKRELEEMKGPRAIGKAAPDIVGDDQDAKSFKLSDYKGKVVLLDFWGFW
jgi:hypothetical protein